MTAAGDLFYRVHCQKRAAIDDGMGNTVSGDWETQFSVNAAYKHVRGREEVLAGRLEGVHPILITVRRTSQTVLITSDWKLVDARDGTEWAVRDVTHETDRAFITFLCASGVAA